MSMTARIRRRQAGVDDTSDISYALVVIAASLVLIVAVCS